MTIWILEFLLGLCWPFLVWQIIYAVMRIAMSMERLDQQLQQLVAAHLVVCFFAGTLSIYYY